MLQGMQAGDLIGGAQRLGPPLQRWMIAHAIGRRLLLPPDLSSPTLSFGISHFEVHTP